MSSHQPSAINLHFISLSSAVYHLSYLMVVYFLSSHTVFSQEERMLVDRIDAIVGDNIVLHSDIELQYQQMKLEGTDVPGDFKCAILNQMLAQKMLLEQAELDSLVVGEDEIESELDRRIRYFVSMIGSEEKLEEYYGKSIIRIKAEFKRLGNSAYEQRFRKPGNSDQQAVPVTEYRDHHRFDDFVLSDNHFPDFRF